ncbi:MAG TPA: DUF4214 domain-containing protein [Pyrinomonadaceae bacterium]|nr:DUF4214 domain-containing protein [Pyrinomonadaceae bacterium]
MRRLIVALFLTALCASFAVAQGQSAPTLRVVTEDPSLPSELFYGDTRVKPVRLRPGTNTRITIDDNDFFVQQQYIDFLSRFPEPEGFNAWMRVLNNCNGDANCLGGVNGARVLVSKSFFEAQEFQIKGYLVYRYYKASLGRLPTYPEIVAGMRSVTGATEAEVIAKREAFASGWVSRADFAAKYPAGMSAADFVNSVLQTAGVTVPNKDQLIAELSANNTAAGRASVLKKIVESPAVNAREYDPAYVAMQYYGYLRREPETEGYNAWLTYLRANPGDYKTMVWGFVYSSEYRNRH